MTNEKRTEIFNWLLGDESNPTFSEPEFGEDGEDDYSVGIGNAFYEGKKITFMWNGMSGIFEETIDFEKE